jgi:hypothetical protein
MITGERDGFLAVYTWHRENVRCENVFDAALLVPSRLGERLIPPYGA